ncbi:MAG TPA: type II secretion system protein [Candidatus Angelobacter sp.]|jgi:prepilin-type N-terminal cleavage/methylation domain-containing protein|nr:type II secretion system protein [Candidatus Angelobacter sp.]
MKNKKHSRQSGFTLIEMLMVVLLLSIVVGAVFSQIERAQVRYRVEDQKVDLTQQEREFIDQFTRDLHQAGFPSAPMFGGVGTANQVARGVIALTSNDIVIEGDVDGDGAVETVEYSYFDGSGWTSSAPNPCPCIRRSQLAKGAAGPATTYTQVQNVLGSSFFTAFYGNGNTITLPASASDLPKIKTVQITLSTQGTVQDNDAHKSIQVTMTGMARLVNN